MLWYRTRHAVRAVFTSFWFWPFVSIVLAVWLSNTITTLGEGVPIRQVDTALGVLRGADAYAEAILTTTAAANVTILTFVFSTLMIVLQLASSQLSPRILRTIVREGSAQTSMAVMVGGFVFSLYSLLNVYGSTSPVVPRLLAMVAMLWTIVIVLTFLRFVSYTIGRIRAPAVIQSIARTTAHGIRHTYSLRETPSARAVPEWHESAVIGAPHDGIVTGLSMRDIARWAARQDATVKLEVGLGDYVSAGVPIGVVRSARSVRSASVLRFMVIEPERTLVGDPPYGFRLLVDIANRALSPAINDPTTAVQVLDELQSLLVLLASRPEQPGRVYDADGLLRLDMPVMQWTAYLRLAVQEVFEYGRDSSQVTQRIHRMLKDLAGVVDSERLEAVEHLRATIQVVPPLLPDEAGG